MRHAAPWLGLWAVATLLEAHALRTDPAGTLSAVTRATWHTDTVPGRVAFVAGWCLFSGWFVPHICRRAAGTARFTAAASCPAGGVMRV